MVHRVHSSTSGLFRTLMLERHRQLFAAKWSGREAPAVSPLIVRAVRAGRGPRQWSIEELREIVGVAAADCTAYLAGSLDDGLTGLHQDRDDLANEVRALRQELDRQSHGAMEAQREAVRLRLDVEFVRDQFVTAGLQRDRANQRLREIEDSRAWRAVEGYWRWKARLKRLTAQD